MNELTISPELLTSKDIEILSDMITDIMIAVESFPTQISALSFDIKVYYTEDEKTEDYYATIQSSSTSSSNAPDERPLDRPRPDL